MQRKTEPVSMWFDARIVVRQSPIQGVGVFATAPIKAGEQLMRVSGGIVYTQDDWDSGRVQLEGSLYNEERIGDDLYLAVPKSIFYYVNHSCDPNFGGEHEATRDIEAGEELTTDYVTFLGFPNYVLEPCTCGSSLCRGKVTGNDWKLPELQERYKGQFTDYVEGLIQQMNEGTE